MIQWNTSCIDGPLSIPILGDPVTDPQFTVALKFADEAEARGVLAGYWQDSTTGA